MKNEFQLEAYNYHLDESLIAHSPAVNRDQSRIMVVNRESSTVNHGIFADIIEYFKEGDVLVRNNTRVFPARLIGHKTTGAEVEMLLIRQISGLTWEVMARPGKRLKSGDMVVFSDELKAEIVETLPDGNKIVRFLAEGDLMAIVQKIGLLPLPHYIDTGKSGLSDSAIRDRYQTVFARDNGSCAAPTAGLHFTPELFEKLAHKGVRILDVTLHVGPGTFKPVQTDDIREHVMHKEYYHVAEKVIQEIAKAKKEARRVIAVGTTSTRVLESIGNGIQQHKSGDVSGETNIFIYPGYRFVIIDALITNFHLPKSSLLMLVSAFAGKDLIMKAYQEAQDSKYRFFSFGDAMLLL